MCKKKYSIFRISDKLYKKSVNSNLDYKLRGSTFVLNNIFGYLCNII